MPRAAEDKQNTPFVNCFALFAQVATMAKNYIYTMFSWLTSLFRSAKNTTQLPLTEGEKAALSTIDERIVIGQIMQIDPHPDPKVTKVRVTQTKIGGETAQILCGASNIAEGMVVPVATVGTDLGGGFIISERAIRGVTSMGMICSKKELGLTESDDGGIWPLPEGLKSRIGAPLKTLA